LLGIFSGMREWVYPQGIKGTFQKVHRWSALAFHLWLIIVPWIYVGGHPAVRLDLPSRKLYVLGSVFTSTDAFLLTLLALSAAFGLFFMTALLGRIWCGYMCPQSVLMEEWVRPIEKFFEGDRSKRKRRDAGPWSFDRIWRKAAKLTAFLVAAWFISMSFGQWFAGAYELWTWQASAFDYSLVGFFTAIWFLDFAWFREQTCNYVCPYARFQGAMTDQHSLTISYDAERGEPRKKGKATGQKGGCIDCNKCVVVCPQGIDIRDGFQLECISCARCIDACETVMTRFDQPTLVRYSTYSKDEGKKLRIVRPRTLVYTALLLALSGTMVAMLLMRTPIEAQVNRAPGTHYAVDADEFVRNTYLLRIANNKGQGNDVAYSVRIEGLESPHVQVPPIHLDAGKSATVPLIVRLPTDRAPASKPFQVHVISAEGEVWLDATFQGPTGD
jgi:cytochrome c oxidase accessory protein FixG